MSVRSATCLLPCILWIEDQEGQARLSPAPTSSGPSCLHLHSVNVSLHFSQG